VERKNIEVLEMDEIETQVKKVKNKEKYTFIWIAADRNRNKESLILS
jgi:hypothetical protein